MTFKEVIEQLHQEGKTEEEAMNTLIAKVQAAGAEWTPPKMELFYKAWEHLESLKPKKVEKKSEVEVKPKKLLPIDKLKRDLKDSKVENKPEIIKKSSKVIPAPVTPVSVTAPGPGPAAGPINNSGNLGSVNAFLIYNLATISWLNGKNLSSIRDLLSATKSTLDSFIKKISMKNTNYNKIYSLMLDAKKYSDKHASEVVGLGKDIAAIIPVFSSREYHFSADKLKLLKGLGDYFKSSKRSDNQYKNIVNKARVLNIPALNQLFAGDVAARLPKVSPEELGALYSRWLALNKKLGGNEYHVIPTPEEPPKKFDKKGKIIPHVKPEKTPTQIEYAEVGKTLRTYYKDMIRSIVMMGGEKLPNSDHTTMDVKDVKAELAKLGMKWNNIPVGFIGRINTECALCTPQGWTISMPLGGVVKMSKNYDPKTGSGGYCFGVKPTRIKPDGTLIPSKGKSAVYSEKHTQAGGTRDKKKIGIVDSFLKQEDSYRKKWFNIIKIGLKDPEKTPHFALAVMLESMYQVAPRPGSKEEGGTNTHFTEETKGFTYLQKKNVKVEASKITFDFYDKNGRQLLYLHKQGRPEPDPQNGTEAAIIYNAVKYYYDKAPTEDSFVWTGPDNKNIKYKDLGAFMKAMVPIAHFGLHKFRHIKATKIAMSILRACPYAVGKASSKECSEYYIKAMEEVGAKLGHRSVDKVSSTQAIKSYVSKTVSREFFERYGVKEAPGIAKIINAADSEDEGGGEGGVEQSSTKEYTIIVGKKKRSRH